MTDPLMPKGVEHTTASVLAAYLMHVTDPLMPKGVEHTVALLDRHALRR